MYHFEKYAQEAHEFTNEVARELGTDPAEAFRSIKAVFHTLREAIGAAESLHLVSQLPMILKAVYVDGWKIAGTANKVKDLDQFLSEVKDIHSRLEGPNNPGPENPRRDIDAVFKVLKNHITEGELRHVKDQLPKDVKELIPV